MTPTRRWWSKTSVRIAAGVVGGLVILAAIGSQLEPEDDEPTATPDPNAANEEPPDETATSAERTTTSERLTTTAAPTTTTIEATTLPTIGAGTYIVGSEVAPGVYRVERYWATLDPNQEILDNDLVQDGLSIAVVTEEAAFIEFSGEAIRVEDLPVVDPMEAGFTDGTYLVGADLPPGQYRVSDERGAYGARLDSSLNIIDNDLNEGSVILTVQESDFAFTYSGTLERLP